MSKTIGILAHVDAGKTTVAEQILYLTKSINYKGRVDNKDSFLDNHKIEKERGITIFSEQGYFEYNNYKYYLIDTPGHVDFSTEMERAISIMDYAIIVISAVEGIQAHTETVYNLLKEYNVPIFLFINKIDRENIEIETLTNELVNKLDTNCIDISGELINNTMSENLIEFIAERDEMLLEEYLNGNYNYKTWEDKLKILVNDMKVIPIIKGSALRNIGIENLLEKINILTVDYKGKNDEFDGNVYKVRYDDKGTRVTYMKITSGSLKIRDEITYMHDSETIKEKVNQIRIYNGNKFKVVDEAYEGDIVGLVGISKLIPSNELNIIPTLATKIIIHDNISISEVLRCFNYLEEENPSLNVIYDKPMKYIKISVSGVIQIEILKDMIKSRFKIDIDFGPCEILYKETIDDNVIGCGHFEPLGHYAEVILNIESGKRGSGIVFSSNCHVDSLAIGQQNLIKKHIFEKNHKGILCGMPITDLNITLIDGRAHNKHTSGGDFREATLRAIRQGLEKATNRVLEPYYKFKIEVNLNHLGKVISDIQKHYGTFDEPYIENDIAIIYGRGPVATFMNYSIELTTFTKGKGIIILKYDGYDYCHNSEHVINYIEYKKDEDREYSSSSIFCSKGESYSISWNEAEEYMHCKENLYKQT